MGFWDNLKVFVDTVVTLKTIDNVNTWINEKARQIANPQTKITGLIDIAYNVGIMDNDTWKAFSAGLEMKSFNSDFQYIKDYCNYVVRLETGKFRQLLSLSSQEAAFLLIDDFQRSSNAEEQCAYLGLLKSRSQDVKASYILNQLIDTLNNQRTIQTRPSGFIESVWTAHNIFQNNEKGMYIHTRFQIDNSRGKESSLIAWFYYGNGIMLEDLNGRYGNSSKHVCVWQAFTPSYDSTSFKEFTLFIPYDEFHIQRTGTYEVKFYVGLFSGNDLLAESNFISFNFQLS